jgi:hypothetical protein
VSASGPGSASATVNSIGGSSAANVHSAELAANAATSINTVSTIVKRDSNGNFVSNNTVNVSTGNACSGTITLSAASSKIQVFSSGSGSCSVVLPDATTLAIGWEFELNNNASGVVTVKDNTASTLFTMTAGSYVKVITTSISFAAGQWDKHWLMPANASYGTSGLSVTGTITQSSLTASTALVADSSKNISSSSVTSTELGYVSGVTSGIQSQINGKQATGNYITALTGDVTASGPGSVAATLTNASVTGQALTGFSSGSGTVTASDTILTAFNKVYGWIVKIWVDEINGQVETVANKTYVLVDKARYARTVDKINIVCNTSGTVTVNLKIGSTSITSCSAISVTSTPGDTTCTAANAMVADDQLTMVTTSNSACLDLAFTVQTTRN